ncbi:MAG: leucine-rich repeat domain-containing protein [Acholeplasmataceae bacterium]|jgi:hypothetical protein
MKKILMFIIAFLATSLLLSGCGKAKTISLDLPEGISLVDGELNLKKLELDSMVEFLITPESGKKLEKLLINGVDETSIVVNNKFRVRITENLTISVEFTNITPSDPTTFTVTLSDGLSSTNPLTNLLSGAIVNIRITIPPNKEIVEFKVDGFVIDLNGALTYKLTVSQDHDVEVTFKDKDVDPETSYTVTWKNYDGTILKTDENVASGTIPEYNGQTPTKPGGYIFIGWSPELSAVVGNVVYTATFSGDLTPSEDFIFYDLGNSYALYNYYGNDTRVVIPETYQEKPVTLIDKDAFKSNKRITSVVIPNSVEIIEEYAFYECTSLTTVVFGSGVKQIKNSAFNGCKVLSSINLPEGLTHLGDYSFSRCGSLKKLNLPNSIESYGYSVLSYSSNIYNTHQNGRYLGNSDNPYLVLVELSDNAVEEFSIHDDCKVLGDRAFSYGYNLKTVHFGESLQYIGNRSFSQSKKLGQMVIPKTVLKIDDYAFANSSITYLGFEENSNIKHIGNEAFAGCENLTTVYLSNSLKSIGEKVFNGSDSINKKEFSNVYYIGSDDNPYFLLLDCKVRTEDNYTIHNDTKMICHDAFNYCTFVTNITIPRGVRFIGLRAFKDCRYLTSIIVESGNEIYAAPNNTAIIELSTNTLISGLYNLIFPQGVVHIGDYALAGIVTDSINIPETVKSIGKYAISQSSAKTINVPNSVTSIGEGAFYQCINITAINIPNTLKYIPNAAYRECIMLKNVHIPNSVSYVGRAAFYNCGAVETISFGNSLVVISMNAFDGCSNLESITIPDCVEALEYQAFAGCKKVTSLFIGKEVKIIGEFVFELCHGLTQITIDEDNKFYDSREDCNGIVKSSNNTLIFGIKTTTIPNSIKTIGDSAFFKCNGIDSIVLGDGVTVIEEYAFAHSSLKSISLGKNLTYIGTYAFSQCGSLTKIIIPSTVIHMGYYAFDYSFSVVIYCEATTQPYDWAPNWNSSNRPVYWYSEEANYDGAHWRYVEGVATVWVE